MTFRAAAIGFRAGVLVWLVMGKPSLKVTKKEPSDKVKTILELARWVAEYVQYYQYYAFGEQMDEQMNSVCYNKVVPVNKMLFSTLPHEFDLDDLALARRAQSVSSTPDTLRKIVSRWLQSGMIRRDNESRKYVKLKESVY